MTILQKRAIGYAVRAKRNHLRYDYIVKHGLAEDFENSKYKTFGGYLRRLYSKMVTNGEPWEKLCELSKVLRY